MSEASRRPDATIGVIGGTGKLGAAIARRLAKAGRKVVIGSRSAESAEAAARELGFGLSGMANADAAQAADIVIVTVPFAAQDATLREIAPHVAGKIVVDTTVPLVPPKVMRVQLPAEGSAAARAQQILGEGVTVVSGFHNVAAHKLITDADIGCDVLVFGDDKAAREAVVELANAAGLRGLHGGALVNSAAAEAMTSILIFLNKTYQVDGAGIRITGELIPPSS
jgi:NADPH-dependent F420 reductase